MMAQWLWVILGFLIGLYVGSAEERDDPLGALIGGLMLAAIAITLIVLIAMGVHASLS